MGGTQVRYGQRLGYQVQSHVKRTEQSIKVKVTDFLKCWGLSDLYGILERIIPLNNISRLNRKKQI